MCLKIKERERETVLYCTVLYCTVLYCTVLYYTIMYCTELYCIVLYCTVLYYTGGEATHDGADGGQFPAQGLLAHLHGHQQQQRPAQVLYCTVSVQ